MSEPEKGQTGKIITLLKVAMLYRESNRTLTEMWSNFRNLPETKERSLHINELNVDNFHVLIFQKEDIDELRELAGQYPAIFNRKIAICLTNSDCDREKEKLDHLTLEDRIIGMHIDRCNIHFVSRGWGPLIAAYSSPVWQQIESIIRNKILS